MTDSAETRQDLLDEIGELVTALEAHPDATVRGQVTALLQGVDAVHRVALTRLLEAIQGLAGEAFVNRLTADPVIRLLFMSYDLIAVDRRIQTEEALDAVRGHLHAHGVDVELLDVVGSVVYVKLHGLGASGIAPDAVRHDLEEALRHGLVGFHELQIGDRQTGAGGLVQLGGKRPLRAPVYRRVVDAAALLPGTMEAVDLDGDPVLVANVDGEFYAVSNRCGESPLPLHFGALAGAELLCSWHGCRYDLRSGRRLDGGSDRLTVYPVAVADGEVRVAVGAEA